MAKSLGQIRVFLEAAREGIPIASDHRPTTPGFPPKPSSSAWKASPTSSRSKPSIAVAKLAKVEHTRAIINTERLTRRAKARLQSTEAKPGAH
jgi:hypothetical protein